MNNIILYPIFFLLSVFISSISQVLLKKSASMNYKNKIREYVNLKVIVAYLLFFSCTLITVACYKKIPLALGPILESSGYVFISILGKIFFNESFSKKKILGLIIIICGIIVFSL